MLTIGFCPPPAVPIHQQALPPEPDVPGRRTLLQPYASPVDLRGGLGIVLSPTEYTRSLGPGAGPWLNSDPERLYPDTMLGTTPSDYDIMVARGGCSLPVHSGWTQNQWNGGLGEAMFGETLSAIDTLAAHQRRMFWLSIVSTAAVTTLALVNLYKLLKE
jgi:hypothetical protein